MWLLRILKNIPRELNGALLRLIQTILRLYSAATPLSPSSSPSTRSPLTICASSAPAPVISSQMQGSVPFSTSPLGTGGSDSNGVAVPPPSNQSHADEASTDPPLHNRELAQRDGTTANPSNRSLLRGASPDEFMRRRFSSRAVNKDATTHMVLQAGDTDYDDELNVDGWLRCTQPEGALYYIYEEKNIVTDVATPEKRRTILRICDDLLETAQRLDLPLHSDVQLVIGYSTAHRQREWGYYFVDHRRKLLFWVHEYNLSSIFTNVRGVTEKSHMRQAITTQYWMHVELYPNLRKLKAEDHEELRNILIQAIADATTSGSPLVPYELDTMEKMLSLVDSYEGSIGKENTHAVWVTGRFMRLFSHCKFVNFSGQRSARLNADQSIYTTRHSRGYSPSLFIKVFDWILFGSGSSHAEELDGAWVDKIIHFPRWKAYITKLNAEWSGFTFYSTVLLAVNVSLLAIPALGGGGGGGPNPVSSNSTSSSPGAPQNPPSTSQQTAAIIAIYLSILFVVGALVTSIQLSDHIRGKEHSSATEASKVLQRTAESRFGTDGLAITFSLPYAFLIWGILLFVLGLSLVIFASSSRPMPVIIGPIMLIVVLFAIWPSLGSKGYFSGAAGPWRTIAGWTNVIMRPFFREERRERQNGTIV